MIEPSFHVTSWAHLHKLNPQYHFMRMWGVHVARLATSHCNLCIFLVVMLFLNVTRNEYLTASPMDIPRSLLLLLYLVCFYLSFNYPEVNILGHHYIPMFWDLSLG